jgi:beta-galactosidase/beta-glucuronidase
MAIRFDDEQRYELPMRPVAVDHKSMCPSPESQDQRHRRHAASTWPAGTSASSTAPAGCNHAAAFRRGGLPATVWVNGHLVAIHEGGHTPFSADITSALDPGPGKQTVTVHAEDDPA